MIESTIEAIVRKALREELAAFKEELQASKEEPKKLDKHGASKLTGRPVSYFEKIGGLCSQHGVVEKGPDGKNYFPVDFLHGLDDANWEVEVAIGIWKRSIE